MSADAVRVSRLIQVSPNHIYSTWLDGRAHARFTGARANVEPWVGGRHHACDGYSWGTTIALDPGRRIVQTWRSTDFPTEAPDSRVDILLEPAPGGTRVTISHSELPPGYAETYRKSWSDVYLRALDDYFKRGRTPREPATVPRIPADVRRAAAKRFAAEARKAVVAAPPPPPAPVSRGVARPKPEVAEKGRPSRRAAKAPPRDAASKTREPTRAPARKARVGAKPPAAPRRAAARVAKQAAARKGSRR